RKTRYRVRKRNRGSSQPPVRRGFVEHDRFQNIGYRLDCGAGVDPAQKPDNLIKAPDDAIEQDVGSAGDEARSGVGAAASKKKRSSQEILRRIASSRIAAISARPGSSSPLSHRDTVACVTPAISLNAACDTL